MLPMLSLLLGWEESFSACKKPKSEVINDRSSDVTNLFRILNRHFPQFWDVLNGRSRAVMSLSD